MSKKFEPGDRVKVEFEAQIAAHNREGDAYVTVFAEPYDDFYVDKKWLTLIEPPIVLPEIPGPIVQVDPLNEHGERSVYEYDILNGDEWWTPGVAESTSTAEVFAMCRKYGYRVIPAAEAEGVSE